MESSLPKPRKIAIQAGYTLGWTENEARKQSSEFVLDYLSKNVKTQLLKARSFRVVMVYERIPGLVVSKLERALDRGV